MAHYNFNDTSRTSTELARTDIVACVYGDDVGDDVDDDDESLLDIRALALDISLSDAVMFVKRT